MVYNNYNESSPCSVFDSVQDERNSNQEVGREPKVLDYKGRLYLSDHLGLVLI